MGSVAMWRAATPKTIKFKACLGNFKAEYYFLVVAHDWCLRSREKYSELTPVTL